MKLNLRRFWPFKRSEAHLAYQEGPLFPKLPFSSPKIAPYTFLPDYCLNHRFGLRPAGSWHLPPKCVTCGRPWQGTMAEYFAMVEDFSQNK